MQTGWSKWRSGPFVVALLCAAVSAEAAPRHLTILHFNDFHGYFDPPSAKTGEPSLGGAERLAGLVAAIRKENAAKGWHTILLEGGDLISGTPISERHQGALEFAFLNRLRADAMAVGNHEFDFSVAAARKNIAMATFPVVSANIVDNTTRALFAKPTTVLTLAPDLRVGIVGCTTTTTPVTTSAVLEMKAFTFRDPVAAAKPYVAELAKGTEVQLALTHLGVREEVRLAKAIPALDAVIGGHDHVGSHQYCRWVHDRPVCETPAYGRYIGRIDLAVEDGAVRTLATTLIPIDTATPADPTIARWLAPHRAALARAIGEPIGTTKSAIGFDPRPDHPGATALGMFLAAMIREDAKAHVAFINRGGLRAPLPKGMVTRGDIVKTFPFPNRIVTATMSGKDLAAVVGKAAAAFTTKGRAGEPERRGSNRTLQWAGLRYRLEDGKIREMQIEQAGRWEPLDPRRSYHVATADFLARGGDGFAILTRHRWTEDGPLIRERLIEYVRAMRD